MTKVLVVSDDDGHTSVFDISTPDLRESIIFGLFRDWYENGTGNASAQQIKDDMQAVMDAIDDGKSVDDVMEIYEEIWDMPSFNTRSGRLTEADVKTTWTVGLGRNIG